VDEAGMDIYGAFSAQYLQVTAAGMEEQQQTTAGAVRHHDSLLGLTVWRALDI
jgi:hypothetical protein